MKTNKKTLRERATEFVNSVKNLIKAKNFDFTDEDGTVLFSTEAEDDTLEVGMPASPDGEYTIQDGRTVVIADGAITEIREPSGEGGEENELENLRAENAQLRASLAEATGLIREFNAKNTGSSYQPAQRMGTAGQANKPAENKQLTSAERKAAIKEKLNKK